MSQRRTAAALLAPHRRTARRAAHRASDLVARRRAFTVAGLLALRVALALALPGAAALAACGAGAGAPGTCVVDDECHATPDTPVCHVAAGTCAPPPSALGPSDGSLAAAAPLSLVYTPDRHRESTGLAFRPASGELWIVHRLDDSVTILANPGTASQSAVRKKDPAALHFMHRPSGIAFGENDYWATCGENDGSQTDQSGFAGPTLFPAHPAVFARQTPGGLGSHLDMLHATTWCMGIAHERENVYWVFGGGDGSLVRYDFAQPHPPGADDHSDGDIRFYAVGVVARVEGVPSHLAFDVERGALYVADTGNGRVLRVDATSGAPGEEIVTGEPQVAPYRMDGVAITEFVPPGTLERPSGIAVAGGVVYVGDHATSRLYAFAPDGRLLRAVDTGLARGALAGITVGPDGRIWLVDRTTSRVHRVDAG